MSHPIIASVEEDSRYDLGQISGFTSTSSGSTSSGTNWGLDSIDGTMDNNYRRPCGLSGRGVDVYVMDTGIQYDHVEMTGRAEYSGCDVVDMMATAENPEAEELRGRDCNGHGTGVAGAIGGVTTGVADQVTLRSVRVLKCDGTTSKTNMILAFECVLKQYQSRSPHRPAILQVSIQGSKSRSVKRSIDVLSNHGIIVVTLSGNSGRIDKPMRSCKTSPGAYPGVITVAAIQRDFFAYSTTNMGRCVDLFAPGRSVRLPSLRKPYQVCRAPNACYAIFSGGSFAAPFVSGALSLLLEKCPALPQWKIKYYLTTEMVVKDLVLFDSIPKRYRNLTPNLYLYTGSNMCSISC